jgi:hypothetical protein
LKKFKTIQKFKFINQKELNFNKEDNWEFILSNPIEENENKIEIIPNIKNKKIYKSQNNLTIEGEKENNEYEIKFKVGSIKSIFGESLSKEKKFKIKINDLGYLSLNFENEIVVIDSSLSKK